MPLKLVKGSKESGLTLHSVYIGEICPKCFQNRLIHPEPYIYTCLFCRYSFKVNPVERYKHITILNKGEKK